MKKQLQKVLTVFITISMILSMLPAQFALATEEGNISKYVVYGTEEALATSDHHGHVVELKRNTDASVTWYDYTITVSAYDMQAASLYTTAIAYDPDDVTWMQRKTKNAYVDKDPRTAATDVMQQGKIKASMISEDAALYGEDDQLLGQGISTKGLVSTWAYSYEAGTKNVIENVLTIDATGSLSVDDWTNNATGAKKSISDGYTVYKFPTKDKCELYTMYFKLKDASKDIDSDTFSMTYSTASSLNGSGGSGMSGSTNEPYFHDEKTYMIGFPEVKATVSFAGVKDSATSNAISDATIDIYSDSTRETLVQSVTTLADGTASASLSQNATYYYTVSKSGYTPQNGSFEVTGTTCTVPEIQLSEMTEPQYNLTVTVKDADTDAVINGAALYLDGVDTGVTTTSTGQGVISAAAGTYAVKASKNGYTDATVSNVTVTSAGGTAEIKLVPERVKVKIPVPVGEDGNVIAGSKIKISKKSSNATKAWANGKDTVIYTVSSDGSISNDAEISAFSLMSATTSSNDAELPKNTDFEITFSANSYTSSTVYAKSDETAVKYYSDSASASAGTQLDDAALAASTTLTEVSDPVYTVNVTAPSDGSSTYTVDVTLKNIVANRGTFGLRYDKDLFTLASDSGFTLGNTLELFTPTDDGPQALKSVTTSTDSDTIGYHVFSWQAPVGETLDTTSEAKTIATYKFTLNSGKTASDINADSFNVMPYDKTANGAKYIEHSGGKDEIAKEFLSKLWRYTDADNTAGALATGRLEESKATDQGFYQAFSDDLGVMADVMTVINLDAELGALVFEVIDENGEVVPNAEINVTTSEGAAVKTLKTDATGIAKMAVNTKSGDVTYKYTASCPGYWGAETTPVTIANTTPPTTVIKYITMQKKIYHETKLQDTTGLEVTNASLSGDKFAYNGKDYHFNVKPNTGYKFTAPETVTAVVGGKDITVSFDKVANMYVLPGASVTGEGAGTADENGFKSDNIIIKIPTGSVTVTDEKYTVTAIAGTNGKVEYSTTENAVTNGNTITVSEIAPDGSTGTFTFTANTGYQVERVIVNGVEVDTYDGKGSFTYSFTNVTEDSSIAVTFWDGVTPSTDSIVTLVVGERGTAHVTSPETADVTSERKTYIYNAAGKLTFTTEPESADYVLDAVEKSVDGEAKTAVNTDNGTYDIAIAQSQNVEVYVTFKEKNAEDTFNVFVKSYVVDNGKGTISPIGILTYTKYDSPIFTLKGIEGTSQAAGVLVDDTEIKFATTQDTATYQLVSLTKDTSIGAIFDEAGYVVHVMVDLAQGTNLSTTAPQSGASVTFERVEDGKKISSITPPLRKASFEVSIPAGTWTVTVKKPGYLNCVITDFIVEEDTVGDIYFGATGDVTEAKPIIPIIGDTSGNGLVVSFEDTGVVASALRNNASDNIKKKADVDDSGSVTEGRIDVNKAIVEVGDMAYVKNNYGARYDRHHVSIVDNKMELVENSEKRSQTYAEFKNN